VASSPPHVPELVLALADAFRETLTDGTLAVYDEHLSDIPPSALEEAVRALIRTADRFPSIHAVRAAAAEFALGLADERLALAQVEERIRWARETPRPLPPPPVEPLVLECLTHVGGLDAWRRTEEPGIIRAQFLRLYREARAARIRDACLADFNQPKELTA
jgi:hypothetical protein